MRLPSAWASANEPVHDALLQSLLKTGCLLWDFFEAFLPGIHRFIDFGHICHLAEPSSRFFALLESSGCALKASPQRREGLK